MTKKYMKHIDECGMYYYICNGEEIIAEAFYGDDAQDIVDLLNKQEEQIKELETRNQRQCERLKEITDLMMERDWESLEKMVEDWEEAEEQLKREWGTYGDDV